LLLIYNYEDYVLPPAHRAIASTGRL
jgi:hypothetical protein